MAGRTEVYARRLLSARVRSRAYSAQIFFRQRARLVHFQVGHVPASADRVETKE